MSTFGLINTAYTGLTAARAAMDVAGQNVANVGTAGYTRQRIEQTAIAGAPATSVFVTGVNIGAGVQVQGITRLNDVLVDARVRDTAATSGYWDVAASAASDVEGALNEPGTTGVSATLSDFWAGWQDMGNNAGAGAQGSELIEQGKLLASRIASGYTAAAGAWTASRSAAANSVTQVNDAAAQVASLNQAIVAGRAAGGSVNDLLDRRDAAVGTLARLAGATARDNGNGTIDVVVDGNALVSGTSSRRLALTGATTLADAGSDPVRIVWADRPSVAATPGGGELAARLATLAGPDANGTGGTYAEAAKVYNTLATTLTTQVNALHRTGTTPAGTTGADFFAVAGTGPAALGLTVVPTSVAGIAAGRATNGAADGSVADAIAQLGAATTAPDTAWSAFVSRTAAASKAMTAQATVAGQAATSATTAQVSQSGVDLDEETASLVLFQHAYQGAARVMTAVDEMLDTLINKTGLVGR